MTAIFTQVSQRLVIIQRDIFTLLRIAPETACTVFLAGALVGYLGSYVLSYAVIIDISKGVQNISLSQVGQSCFLTETDGASKRSSVEGEITSSSEDDGENHSKKATRRKTVGEVERTDSMQSTRRSSRKKR